MAAAEQLGYIPSDVGRSLATRSTRQIALVADIDNALYPRLVGPIHDALALRGYRVVVVAEPGDHPDTHSRLLDRSVDAVILTTVLRNSLLPDRLAARGLPFVQLNRVADRTDSDTVVADNKGGGRLVADLLLRMGHQHIAMILGPADASSSADREEGFLERLGEDRLTVPPKWRMRRGFSHEDGRAAMGELMSGATRPTAVFCVNDTTAVGALNAALALGTRVPEQVSVVGFDDLDFASWPCFELTTVHVDLTAMAIRAAELILGRLGSGDSPFTHETIPVHLVERQTHGPAAASA